MILKSYQKTHLATLYFPNITPRAARAHLMRLIYGDQVLLRALRGVGFHRHPRNHYFTKKEVRIIVDFLDEP